MAKDDKPRTTEAIYAAPLVNMLELRMGINQITAGSPDVNGYALSNQIILAKKKREILYKNGYTQSVKEQALFAEAGRDINHSRKLNRNIQRANPDTLRPKEVDAHHIVASGAQKALLSRLYIFAVGIGINDADNGCYLPRYRTTKIASMPDASWHRGIHTDTYHANVYAELMFSPAHTTAETRKTLRSIRERLIAGSFHF